MHRTNNRWLRTIATLSATFLVATGVTVVSAPAASAGDCTRLRIHKLCGAVKNRTDRTMSYTTNIGDNHAIGTCNVWNKNDLPVESWWDKAPCDQIALGKGTVGGNRTGTDVDAFTFNGHGYHERFTRLGKWQWRVKGVWTKIPNGSVADCVIGDNNAVWCTIVVQR